MAAGSNPWSVGGYEESRSLDLVSDTALADGGGGWLVVGQLPDGPLFLLIAPPILTREQVLEIAEQITYTP